MIFKHLDIRDKGRAAQVCAKWRDAANDRSVWRGVEAKLHLRKHSQLVFDSLAQRGIVKIRILSVRRNNLHDIIKSVANFEQLNFSGCLSVSDNGIQSALSTYLPSMSVLNVSLCKRLTDSSIDTVAKHLPNLTSLDISGCPLVTITGLTSIAWMLQRLRYLNLRSCRQVSDRAIGYICGQYANVTGAQGNRDLRTLILQDCQSLSDQALKYVGEGLDRLESLNISFNVSISNGGVRFVADMPSLRELNLSSTEITDAGIAYLAEGAARIESLDLSFCPFITDAALVSMSHGVYQLQTLSLLDCRAVSDEGLCKLLRCAPDITVLNIGQCDNISDQSMHLVAKYLKRLEVLDIYGCHRITAAGKQVLKESLPKLSLINTSICIGD